MIKKKLEQIKRKFGIIGHDNGLDRAISIAMQIAPTRMSVLVQGENGTGKESFSKIIHFLGGQKHDKLVAVNCGSIPEGTIDSELFGHEKGAFTGAIEARKGYFEEASQGTIFLDEIGEMPLSTQVKLLRILEYGEFMKVGSSKVERTHARIVAATNVDLAQAVAKGTFREDLYYRINTVPIHIPPLRNRRGDIMLLFKKFAGDFADAHHVRPIQLTPEAQERLMSYAFPGNIRQLRNLVTQLSALEYQEPTISLARLDSYLPKAEGGLVALQQASSTEREGISERDLLYKVLFDMQRDLYDLKSLVFEQLKKDTMGDQLIKAYPGLFSRRVQHALPEKSMPKLGSVPVAKPTKEIKDISVKLVRAEADVQEGSMRWEDKEREHIGKVLAMTEGNRKAAAQVLDMSERTLYRKIKKYGL